MTRFKKVFITSLCFGLLAGVLQPLDAAWIKKKKEKEPVATETMAEREAESGPTGIITNVTDSGEVQEITPGPIVDEDFEGLYERVYGPLDAPIGTLPPGWADRSSPAADVRYGAVYEDAIEGEKSLRMHVESPGRGKARLEYLPVPIHKGQWLRLGLSIRSLETATVTIGLSSGGDERTIYFDQPVPTQLDWSSGEVVFQATLDDPQARFFIEVDKPNILEIDEFIIEPYLPRRESVVPLEIEDSPNLLPSSSFPDGVHAPWVVLNAYESISDTKEIGPTGMPALRITGAGASLTAPFFGEGRGDYTLSVYLKGRVEDQSLSLILTPPMANPQVFPFRQSIRINEEWRRYTSTVPLDIDVSGYFLMHIVSHANEPVWVDGVQVEKASKMGPLARSAPVEIAVHPLNPMGIAFEDEPLVARVTVYGALSTARKIEGEVYDMAGNSYRLNPLPITGNRPITHNIALKGMGEPKYGSFRLELVALNSVNEPVSRTAEILLHRVRVPVDHIKFSPDSPFGVQMGFLDREATMVGVARALGFKWVRDTENFAWINMAPDPDTLDFARSDFATEAYEKLDMGVLAVLGPAPRWALNQPDDFPLTLPMLPHNREAWKKAAGAITGRFSKRIQAWEPWPAAYGERTLSGIKVKVDEPEGNEAESAEKVNNTASGPRSIDPVFSTAEEYLQMFGDAVVAIREEGGKAALVLDLNLKGDRSYAQKLFDAGFAGEGDVVSFLDDYKEADDGATARLEEDFSWLDSRLDESIPKWVAQAYAGPQVIYNFYRHVPPYMSKSDPQEEAAAVIIQYVSLLSHGVKRIFVPGFATDPFKDLWQPGHRIFNVDGSLNPNAVALSNLMWHLEGKTTGEVYTVADDFDLHTFSDKREAVGILVSRNGAMLRVKDLPPGVVARDVFGNDIDFPAEIGWHLAYLVAPKFTPGQLHFLFETLEMEKLEPVGDVEE